MAAFNYFFGQPREWLEQQIEKVQAEIAAGKTLIQWGAGDSSGQSKIFLTPQARYEMLYAALNALAPDDYPSTNTRTRRTTPRYV
jgi:hypothetical protein